MDTLYEGLHAFLQACYDPSTGGFYETTPSTGRPKLESSARAIRLLERGDALAAIPPEGRLRMANFFRDLQDAETGSFEDPQEERAPHERRGRALGYSLQALDRLGVEPYFPLPALESPGTEHLRSPAAFLTWLKELDWNRPWSAGSSVSAQRNLISRLPRQLRDSILSATFTWLAAWQDPVTGFWGNDAPYRQLSGAFKVSMVYAAFDRAMPRADRLYASVLRVLQEEDCEDSCFVRNSLHLLAAIRPDYRGIPEADRQLITRTSARNIARFRRPSGGFARRLRRAEATTDGCSQAVHTRDALRELNHLPPGPYPLGERFAVPAS